MDREEVAGPGRREPCHVALIAAQVYPGGTEQAQ